MIIFANRDVVVELEKSGILEDFGFRNAIFLYDEMNMEELAKFRDGVPFEEANRCDNVTRDEKKKDPQTKTLVSRILVTDSNYARFARSREIPFVNFIVHLTEASCSHDIPSSEQAQQQQPTENAIFYKNNKNNHTKSVRGSGIENYLYQAGCAGRNGFNGISLFLYPPSERLFNSPLIINGFRTREEKDDFLDLCQQKLDYDYYHVPPSDGGHQNDIEPQTPLRTSTHASTSSSPPKLVSALNPPNVHPPENWRILERERLALKVKQLKEKNERQGVRR